MSTLPPPFDPSDDDADEQYRRASERDPSRPSEATRRAVLAHAARLAAERARRDARRGWLTTILAPKWRPAIVGTLAAAILAGVLIGPQFFAPAVPPEGQRASATVPAPVGSAQPVNAPVLTERARVTSGTAREPSRESAPAQAAPAALAPERAASGAVTAGQLEQPAYTDTAPTASLAERVVVTANRRAVTPAVAPAAAPAAPPAPQAAQPGEVVASPPASADPDVLRQAAATGDLAALRVQLGSGGDIDARDGQGRTALLLATRSGQADAVAVLLAHGADPSAADAQGTTPLEAAVAADERRIIALLRRYGAR